jgi:hypothetical protein
VIALLSSLNECIRYKNDHAERDAWLAAEGEKGERRRAILAKIQEAHPKYKKSYNIARRIREERGGEGGGPSEGQALSAEGELQ